jgi:hypothetical protein
MHIKTVHDFRRAIRNGPWAWPGGYPLYFITSDGAALSFKAAKAERRNVLWAIASRSNDGWRVVAYDVNWEDPDLTCDHSGKRIKSAYGEPPPPPPQSWTDAIVQGVPSQAAWRAAIAPKP